MLALAALTVPTDSPAVERVRASSYRLEAVRPDPAGAIALLDVHGRALGPRLDEAQFCALAAAGAAVIEEQGRRATYRVSGTGANAQAFCGRYYTRLNRKQPVAAGALSRSRFERIDWPHGIGAHGYRLQPGRTLAAGARGPAFGTVLHAPALVGWILPDGSVHDGYLLVADAREDLADAALALYLGVSGAALAVPASAAVELAFERVADPARIEAVRRRAIEPR